MTNMKPPVDHENHVVLLGDSIFDNAAYVPGRLSVIEHLRQIFPSGWQATLLAIDGDITSGVAGQTDAIPPSATHLLISVGGNDALQKIGMFSEPAGTVGEALRQLAGVRDDFRQDYRQMLWYVLGLNLPVAVCTIYNSVPGLGSMEKTALALFNEIILQEAFMARVPVIDLRLICNEEEDYSCISPIEPSLLGGEKIARAIVSLLETHDFASGHSTVISQVAVHSHPTADLAEEIELQSLEGDIEQVGEAESTLDDSPLSKEQLEKTLATRMDSYPMALRATEEEVRAVRDLFIAIAQPAELRPRKYANLHELENIQSLQNYARKAYGPNGAAVLPKTDPFEAFGPNGFVTASRAKRRGQNID